MPNAVRSLMACLLFWTALMALGGSAMADPRASAPAEHRASYVPEPRAASTEYLIGAHYFPGWKEGTHYGWGKIEPYPERKPLLGWYDEGSPEVADWEIKWAVEHGISFFVYCWYRDTGNLGKPVTPEAIYLGHAIHDGLMKARYRDKFHFAIMWENANAAGVSSLEDLMQNLLPFWIETYFKHPSYLKVDNKPLLFVYYPDGLVRDFGGAGEVRAALDEMRAACRKAGFDGLTVLGEYRGDDPAGSAKLRDCGFDYSFAYCWHTEQRRPTPEQARARQMSALKARERPGVLPFIPTATMGWDPMPWQDDSPGAPWLNPDTMTRWRLTPDEYRKLLVQIKAEMRRLPADGLGHRMLLLDNWNEWGEGHYLAPHAEHGFGYLEAVREVFTRKDNTPDYRLPQELGLGPYDSLYRDHPMAQKQ